MKIIHFKTNHNYKYLEKVIWLVSSKDSNRYVEINFCRDLTSGYKDYEVYKKVKDKYGKIILDFAAFESWQEAKKQALTWVEG